MPHWITSRKKHTVPDETCSDCSVEQGSHKFRGPAHSEEHFFWFFWMGSPNSGKRKEVRARAAVSQLYWTAPTFVNLALKTCRKDVHTSQAYLRWFLFSLFSF